MKLHRLPLPVGNHDLEAPIEGARFDSFLAQNGFAKLVLAVRTPQPEVQTDYPPATNLAIYVGAEGAYQMMSALLKLAKTTGWPLPKEVE